MEYDMAEKHHHQHVSFIYKKLKLGNIPLCTYTSPLESPYHSNRVFEWQGMCLYLISCMLYYLSTLVYIGCMCIYILPSHTGTCNYGNWYCWLVSVCAHEHSITSSTTQSGISPIYVASMFGNTEVVDTLLKYGADPNLATKVWRLVLFIFVHCVPSIFISLRVIHINIIHVFVD